MPDCVCYQSAEMPEWDCPACPTPGASLRGTDLVHLIRRLPENNPHRAGLLTRLQQEAANIVRIWLAQYRASIETCKCGRRATLVVVQAISPDYGLCISCANRNGQHVGETRRAWYGSLDDGPTTKPITSHIETLRVKMEARRHDGIVYRA